MKYDDALELVSSKIQNENLIRHMLAVGAAMKALAEHLGEPPDKWEITGVLHDIDLGETNDMAVHGRLGASWLEEMGMEADICQAIRAHAGHENRETNLAKALFAVDQLTGLIVACALVKGKKLSNVTVKTVKKRFKEKRFAAGADRKSILTCSELGLSLDAFIEITLKAMQNIADDLGL